MIIKIRDKYEKHEYMKCTDAKYLRVGCPGSRAALCLKTVAVYR